MNINVRKVKRLLRGATIKTAAPLSLFQGDDAKGLLKHDEERSAIQHRLIYIRMGVARTHAHKHTHRRAHTRALKSQQASVILLWEREASPSHSLNQEVMTQNTSLTNSNYLH